MARIAKITRTITVKTATVKGLNTTGEAEERTFSIPATVKTYGDMIKHINKVIKPEDFCPAIVTEVTEKSALYAMTESDFIAHAELVKEV